MGPKNRVRDQACARRDARRHVQSPTSWKTGITYASSGINTDLIGTQERTRSPRVCSGNVTAKPSSGHTSDHAKACLSSLYGGISDSRMSNRIPCQRESSVSELIKTSQAVVSASLVCHKHARTGEILINDATCLFNKLWHIRRHALHSWLPGSQMRLHYQLNTPNTDHCYL
jgi:hypothetical protein